MAEVPRRSAVQIAEAAIAVVHAGAPSEPPRLSGPLKKQASNWVSGLQQRQFEVAHGKVRYWHSIEETSGPPRCEHSLLGMELGVDANSESTFRVMLKTEGALILSTEVWCESWQDPHSREEWLNVFQQNAVFAKRNAAFQRASKMVSDKGATLCPEPVESDKGAKGSDATAAEKKEESKGSDSTAAEKKEESPEGGPLSGGSPGGGYAPRGVSFPAEAPESHGTEEGKRRSVQVTSFTSVTEYTPSFVSMPDPDDYLEEDMTEKPEDDSPSVEAAVNLLAHGEPKAPPRLFGPLAKLATRLLGGYQVRHFEVADGKVRYWHAESNAASGEMPCAEYNLYGVKVKPFGDTDSSFEVSFKEKLLRPYSLQAEVGSSMPDAHSREEWIEAIHAHETFAKKKITYAWAQKVADC